MGQLYILGQPCTFIALWLTVGYPQVRVRWARQRLVGATIRGDASEKRAKLAQK